MQEKLQKAFMLTKKKKEIEAELKQLNDDIANDVIFEPGKKTSHIIGGGVKATVQKKETINHDQKKLLEVKKHFSFFDKLFKPEYKQISKREVDKTMLKDPDFRKAMDWAIEIKEYFYVTYEQFQEENDMPF